MEKTYAVEGMKCDGCANTVQTRIASLSNVTDVKVDLAAKTATVTGEASVEEMNKALEGTRFVVKA